LRLERAHLVHVLLAVERVDDRAGAEEQQALEERVRHQVEDAGGKCADADADHHVADLADGRVGEDALDVGLHDRDGCGEESGHRADGRDYFHRARGQHVEKIEPRDHIDAGGHHGGGMDQRADGSRTNHRVGQPYVERNLRRLAGRAEEQQQPRPARRAASRSACFCISTKSSVQTPCCASAATVVKMPIRKPGRRRD
jgi:hypothetical protein